MANGFAAGGPCGAGGDLLLWSLLLREVVICWVGGSTVMCSATFQRPWLITVSRATIGFEAMRFVLFCVLWIEFCDGRAADGTEPAVGLLS